MTLPTPDAEPIFQHTLAMLCEALLFVLEQHIVRQTSFTLIMGIVDVIVI